MPRRIFPAGSVANQYKLRPITFWASSTTTRDRYVDLRTVVSGAPSAPIPNGVLVTDTTGAYQSFAGPDGVNTVWLDTGDGQPRTQITATAPEPGSGAPSVATGGRPSASTVGAGTEVYDNTLKKPIWSDGSVWRDAAGTAV